MWIGRRAGQAVVLVQIAAAGLTSELEGGLVQPAVATDLVVSSADAQNVLGWTSPSGTVTQIEILAKTGDCSFSADPDSSEAKGATVGNAIVLFNDDPTADLVLTPVTVGGGATNVTYDAATKALTHSGLTNGTAYCYKVYARNLALFDDGVGGRPTVSGTPCSGVDGDAEWVHSASVASLAAPSIIRNVGVFFGDNGGRIFGIGQGDGQELFRPEALSNGVQGRGPAGTLAGDTDATLFVGALNGDAYALWASGSNQGTVRWSTEGIDGDSGLTGDQPLGVSVQAAPAIATALNRAFVATRNLSSAENRIFALDAKTGACSWVFNGSCAGTTTTLQLGQISQRPLVDPTSPRLFVTSAELGGGATVWALDINDTPVGQRLLWSRDLGDVDAAAAFDGLSRSGLFIGTNAGRIYRLAASNGSSCWGSTADGCGSASGSEQFFCTDPAVEARSSGCANGSAIKVGLAQVYQGAHAGSVVFSSADGAVRLLSPLGVQQWKTTVPGAGYPLVLRNVAGGKVYLGGSDGLVHQLDLASGTEEATRAVGGGAVVVGDPGYDNQAARLVVNTSEGKLYSFSVPF